MHITTARYIIEIGRNITNAKQIKKMKTIKVIGAIVIIIIAVAVLIKWASRHDEKVMIAADKYEECVRNEYGMSPSKWYAEQGEYPTCDFNSNN